MNVSVIMELIELQQHLERERIATVVAFWVSLVLLGISFAALLLALHYNDVLGVLISSFLSVVFFFIMYAAASANERFENYLQEIREVGF